MKKQATSAEPIKLDLGCGNRKQAGFTGVDKVKLPDVDIVWDLEKFPYPFKDGSVDEVFCSHYVEHTTDFIKFMNEVYRILKVGGKCTIVAPYYASIRAWMDPTHKRAISETTFLYLNKGWREREQLDHSLDAECDFDFSYGYNLTPEWAGRHEDARNFAIRHYINVVNDIQVILTKREPTK